jgi:hypothetical protein
MQTKTQQFFYRPASKQEEKCMILFVSDGNHMKFKNQINRKEWTAITLDENVKSLASFQINTLFPSNY